MRSLRVVTAAALLVALAVPASAKDLGTIRGRIVDGVTGAARSGVEVVLSANDADGEMLFERRTVTDGRGRYRFERLQTGNERFYSLDAIFQGGMFAGGVITIPDDTTRTPVIETKLRVWPTTTDPDAIVIGRDDIFVVQNQDGVGVIEAVTVNNLEERAYIGRGSELVGDDASGASLGLPLPPGASGVAVLDSEIDIPKLIEISSGVAATIAIPPGETRITFSYTLPASAGSIDLTRPALYPTLELSILAAEPLEVRSNRLEERGSLRLSGEDYRRWSSTEALDAGDPLQAIAVASASAPVAPLLAAGAAVLALVVLAIWWMRRKDRRHADSDADLVTAVAELDLRFEAGELPRASYQAQRARLKERLQTSDRGR